MSSESHEYISLNCPRCTANLTENGDVITCPYCGAKLILRRSTTSVTSPAAGENTTIPGAPQGGIRLTPFSYSDSQTGLVAFQMLIPTGWQPQGGIQWTNNHLAPVRIHLLIANPSGPEALECLPGDNFGFTSDPMLRMTIPEGGNFYGAEFRPPHNGLQAVQAIILPRYRATPNIQIVSHEPAPDLARRAMGSAAPSPNNNVSAEGFRVKVRYNWQEKAVLEEISGAITYLQVQTPGMMGVAQTVYWSTTLISTCRAEEERFDAWLPLFHHIMASIKMNPQWTATVQQIANQMAQGVLAQTRQAGQAALQRGRQISQMNDMIYEQGRQRSQAMDAAFESWHDREASRDRIQDEWVHTIRGTDDYYDPNQGKNVELDSSYRQVWSSPGGEYILTDDVLFDPNIGGNTNWTRLDPSK